MYWITHIEGGPKRVNHAAVAVGHKIYTFGGYCTGDNLRGYTSMDVHVLNTRTFRWTKHPVSDLPYFENDDILPYKRYGHTAVLHGEKIYVWGGRNDRASCSTLFCFDTGWHCWTAPRCIGDIPLARDGHTACVWRNKMIIFGGYEDDSGAFARSVYMLDLDRMDWSYVYTTGDGPTLRDFHTAVCIDDKMYLFGGRGADANTGIYLPGDDTYCSHLWYLDLVTHEWHQPETTGAKPIGRRSHSAFVYNNKMYIFGGYNAIEGEHYNDLYEYNPRTCVWRKIEPLGDPPCQRRRQASVLVEDRIFLFGGTSPLPFTTEDARNLSADTLIDHSDMYILDFKPTLKTLCLIVARKYKLDTSILPSNVRIECENMFSSNKITINRPSNSAG